MGMPKKGLTRVHYPDYKKMLDKLVQAREEAGLTQVAAAARLGKLQNFVSKVERGERRIDPLELLLFANLYGKDWTYFVSGAQTSIDDDVEAIRLIEDVGDEFTGERDD